MLQTGLTGPSPTTLRWALLQYLLLILLPTLLLGTGLTYLVAINRVRDVFDMNLLDIASDLNREVESRNGSLVLELPPTAQEMLRNSNQDRISYVLWESQQGVISGDADLIGITPPEQTPGYHFASAIFHGRNHRIVQLLALRAGRSLHISVAQTTLALNGIERSILGSVIFLGTLLTAVALAGVYIGVRRGLKPIAALSAAINMRSPANLAPLPALQAPNELRPIVDNINSLLESLEQSLRAHRHFIADAAHQLRTPLAALNAQFEVALKIPPTDIQITLTQMHATIQRASHLANQLLSLARLEYIEQIPQAAAALTLDEILRAVLPRHVLAAETAGVEMEFAVEPCRVIGNRILLEELFSNLFDNAIRYVPRGGLVRMQGRQRDARVHLSIIDNGPGVLPADMEKLGTAFFRADSGNQNGCGLGLAIAKEIVRLHQGTLQFARADAAGGLRIDIELPAA